MKDYRTGLALTALLVATVGIGWYAGQHSISIPQAEMARTQTRNEAPVDRAWGKLSSKKDRGAFMMDDAALQEGALPGQRTLRFASLEDLEAFLKRAGDQVRVLGRIDALKALRIGFTDLANFNALLDGSEEQGFIYPAFTPNPAGGIVQDDAVPLGNQLLAWLGLTSMDPTMGAGVKIAILDTGVVPHPALASLVKNYFIVGASDNYADWNGHGTAAASLILGNSSTVPGAAPGAELSSWRVADDTGYSDSWKIAQAIMAAADAGNQIISISMGSYGDSSVLRDAVAYAQSKNVVIVASSGNDGYVQSAYPAGYDGVIAAVGVDAQNNHLLFSNQSATTALSAPGWGVNAAYPDDQMIYFSGTSASAPIVAGAIAAVMSAKQYSAQQALAVIYQYTNETGAAGADSYTGAGAINIGRILQSDTSNVQDAAVASHYITPPANGASANVQVNIQNQGTASLLNVPVTVTTPGGVTELIVPSLAPGAVKSFTIGLPNSAFNNNAKVSVSSVIPTVDAVKFNNQRTTTYSPIIAD